MDVSCDQRGQLEVNGRALGVSHAWFQRGNFSAGSYVCVCKSRFYETRDNIILISEYIDMCDVCITTWRSGCVLNTYKEVGVSTVKWVCP